MFPHTRRLVTEQDVRKAALKDCASFLRESQIVSVLTEDVITVTDPTTQKMIVVVGEKHRGPEVQSDGGRRENIRKTLQSVLNTLAGKLVEYP